MDKRGQAVALFSIPAMQVLAAFVVGVVLGNTGGVIVGNTFSGKHICGNSIIESGETCDDGNVFGSDGCSLSCQIEQGWRCNGQPSICFAVCGDGVIAGSEQCDDGNTVSGDGCSSTCRVEVTSRSTPANVYTPPVQQTTLPKQVPGPVCGDGKITGTEECDDGNSISNDGCTSCLIENGFKCSGIPSVCNSTCGDGIKTIKEACDNGVNNGKNCTAKYDEPCTFCTANCAVKVTSIGFCGDNILQNKSGEACDDGNKANNDGCSSKCKFEAGFNCTTGTCRTICGDGLIVGNEKCDDGNKLDNDGCSSACKIETGYTCTGKPSDCVFSPTPIPVSTAVTCQDSDGVNPFSKGTLTTSLSGYAGVNTDTCTNQQGSSSLPSCTGSSCYIKEFECRDWVTTPTALPYAILQCPNGCSNGACNPVSQPSLVTCVDPDGGQNLLVKAETHDLQFGYRANDTCNHDGTITEFFCKKFGVYDTISENVTDCPAGMACLSAEAGKCVAGEPLCPRLSTLNSQISACKTLDYEYYETWDSTTDCPSVTCATNCPKISETEREIDTCKAAGHDYLMEQEYSSDFSYSCRKITCLEDTVTGTTCPSDSLSYDDCYSSGKNVVYANRKVGSAYYSCMYSVCIAHSAICGNGAVEGTEQCDDGNTANGDGCSSSCTVEPGWSCDGTCQRIFAVCGDHVIGADEQCDGTVFPEGAMCSNYGFSSGTLSCDSNCYIDTSACTNTQLQCTDTDLGDNINVKGSITMSAIGVTLFDTCSGNTLNERVCMSNNDYSANTISHVCDFGCSNGVCLSEAPQPPQPVCGNSAVETGETCDDGNTANGDGCSSSCILETGWTCSGTTCSPIHGDGIITGNEVCDDGNTNNGDGCSSTGTVETGFTCTGQPSVCVQCTQDSQCTTGQFCINGLCRVPKSTDYTDSFSVSWTGGNANTFTKSIRGTDYSIYLQAQFSLPSFGCLIRVSSTQGSRTELVPTGVNKRFAGLLLNLTDFSCTLDADGICNGGDYTCAAVIG